MCGFYRQIYGGGGKEEEEEEEGTSIFKYFLLYSCRNKTHRR